MGGGVNYAFGPAVAGFVYTQTNLTQLFQTGFSTHFQNFEGNLRYALTPAVNVAGPIHTRAEVVTPGAAVRTGTR